MYEKMEFFFFSKMLRRTPAFRITLGGVRRPSAMVAGDLPGGLSGEGNIPPEPSPEKNPSSEIEAMRSTTTVNPFLATVAARRKKKEVETANNTQSLSSTPSSLWKDSALFQKFSVAVDSGDEITAMTYAREMCRIAQKKTPPPSDRLILVNTLYCVEDSAVAEQALQEELKRLRDPWKNYRLRLLEAVRVRTSVLKIMNTSLQPNVILKCLQPDSTTEAEDTSLRASATETTLKALRRRAEASGDRLQEADEKILKEAFHSAPRLVTFSVGVRNIEGGDIPPEFAQQITNELNAIVALRTECPLSVSFDLHICIRE